MPRQSREDRAEKTDSRRQELRRQSRDDRAEKPKPRRQTEKTELRR
jgi:hypothetical protein